MMDEHLIDPPQEPDDPKCIHCRKRESRHEPCWHTENGRMFGCGVLMCEDDGEFEPYEDADYAADEADARESAELQKAGL